jgi:hypothetical protein
MQNAANTSTTINFPNPGFAITPDVVVTGMSGAISNFLVSTTQIAVNYPLTSNVKWSYQGARRTKISAHPSVK